MSASHETFEWHLTPTGWVEGSESLDFGRRTERPTPDNRVATFVLDEHQGHVLGDMQSSWNQTWIAPGAKLDALYKQFGKHPDYVAQSLQKYGR